MSELKPDPKGQSLIIAIREFLRDWRKGDFELPKLAQYDVEAIESALDNWLATHHEPVHAAETVEACARIVEGSQAIASSSEAARDLECVAKAIRALPTASSADAEANYRHCHDVHAAETVEACANTEQLLHNLQTEIDIVQDGQNPKLTSVLRAAKSVIRALAAKEPTQ